MARSAAYSHPLTDHEEIRNWAEERGAKPACIRGTGDEEDIGMIRLDFPGYSGEGSLEEISWDEWFDKFDESNLALIVQEETANGQSSNFNKLVSRDSVSENRSESGNGRSRRKKSASRKTSSARGRTSVQGRPSSKKDSARTERTTTTGRKSSQSARSRSAGGARTQGRSGKKTSKGSRGRAA